MSEERMSDERRGRDDELLSAYLDGELPPAETEALSRRLAEEPALARRLEAMRHTDRVTAAAYHSIDERPLPKRVLELLEEDEDERVVPLRRRGAGAFLQLPVALAASVALAAGLWLGMQAGGGASGDATGARIAPGSALHAAFDETPSGQVTELDAGRRAEPVLTFRDAHGDWCRELRISGGPAPAETLACRRDGAWHLEVVSFGRETPEPGEAPYGLASGGGDPAVRAAVGELMGAEPPLAPADEARAIERGWE